MMFKQEVQKFLVDCLKRKPFLKPYYGHISLQGVSGNWWNPDIVILYPTKNDSEDLSDSVKLIGEIKIENFEPTNPRKPRPHTHMEHMWRAGARFCDMRNWRVPKFLLFPYLVERPKGFDFGAYFSSIDVTLLDWSKTEHVDMLRKYIEELRPSSDPECI